MRNAVSILQSNAPLTRFERAVVFTLKTPGADYAIDQTTAEKLSALLLSSTETKFVKVQTAQGQAVLNISSIMAITVNERSVIGTLAFLKDKALSVSKEHKLMLKQIFQDADDEKINWFHSSYREWMQNRELKPLDTSTFAFYFKEVAKDIHLLDDLPLIPATRKLYA
jgi:hypothetical protein